MIYRYFLNLKSYINTYISITYTESTVSNHLPQGNHNASERIMPVMRLLVIIYRKVITTSRNNG